MTETVAFFAAQERFGLPADDLFVFCQGTMPAVDAQTGRVLLEAPGRIAASPDGHGGTLAALGRSGALDDIERRGIGHLFYLQVDNPLVDICGREFVGYHLLAGSEFSTQVIAKRDPLDRVGNVVQVDGRLMVIEYSDLPDDAARRRNPDGSLAIWAGSIAVHVMDVALLRRLAGTADALPFHIAQKKVSAIDAAARTCRAAAAQRDQVRAVHFRSDAAGPPGDRGGSGPGAGVRPAEERPGAKADTAEAVRAQMAALAREWLRQAGAEIDDDIAVEISPLFALDAEELAAKIQPGTRITTPRYFR